MSSPSIQLSADRALRRVAWLTMALFLSYLCVAMSLPVVSVYVTTGLGLGNGLAGRAVGIAFASTILTRGMAGMAMVVPLAGSAPPGGERPSFWSIIGRIWQPGLVVGLQGVGFAATGAFITLPFLSRGWPGAGLGLSCFGGAFVLVRILFGHLPDRVGGIPVALALIAVEAVGQHLLWVAPDPALALLGAFLTGLGRSLVFPAMGLEVVRCVPPHLRGMELSQAELRQVCPQRFIKPFPSMLLSRRIARPTAPWTSL